MHSCKLFLNISKITGIYSSSITYFNKFNLKIKDFNLKLTALLINFVSLSFQAFISYEKLSTSVITPLNEIIYVVCSLIFSFSLIKIQITSIYNLKLLRHISEHVYRQPSMHIELVIITLSFSSVIVTYYIHYDTFHATLFTLGINIPKLILIHASFHFCFYLKTVRSHIDRLISRLNQEHNLTTIFQDYQTIITKATKLNKVYRCTNIFIVANNSVWITYELYHLIILLEHAGSEENVEKVKRNFFLKIYASMWSCITFCSLCAMFLCAASCTHTCRQFTVMFCDKIIQENIVSYGFS